MDFFNSVFANDDHREPDSPDAAPKDQRPSFASSSSSSAWSFGGLIKTLATKSESVMGSYRRDFEEFGSELKKETSIIRQVASRAAKDLPQSLDIGATVAQESLESVGQAIEDIGATVWKSTVQIISHGRESLLSLSEDYDPDSTGNLDGIAGSSNQGLAVRPYSGFEMQLLAVQSDKGTYCRGPDDSGDFENWRIGFNLEGKSSEIDDLLNENKVVKAIYREAVPGELDAETFWSRYFYRVHKLQQAAEARAKLAKRAISGEEEEDLSWDFDEDGDEVDGSMLEGDSNNDSAAMNENVKEKANEKLGEGEGSDSDKVVFVEKVDSGESSCKDSDISVVSTQPSLPEAEDLGWDQIEADVGSNEERSEVETQTSGKKTEPSGWHKRISAAGEEDLSWDVDDDDDDEGKP